MKKYGGGGGGGLLQFEGAGTRGFFNGTALIKDHISKISTNEVPVYTQQKRKDDIQDVN